jgi:hypothetical protein
MWAMAELPKERVELGFFYLMREVVLLTGIKWAAEEKSYYPVTGRTDGGKDHVLGLTERSAIQDASAVLDRCSA